jgi:hypothetical protein
MVGVLTSPPITMVKGRVCHCDRIKRCMETLDLCVYLFVVLGVVPFGGDTVLIFIL